MMEEKLIGIRKVKTMDCIQVLIPLVIDITLKNQMVVL